MLSRRRASPRRCAARRSIQPALVQSTELQLGKLLPRRVHKQPHALLDGVYLHLPVLVPLSEPFNLVLELSDSLFQTFYVGPARTEQATNKSEWAEACASESQHVLTQQIRHSPLIDAPFLRTEEGRRWALAKAAAG